MQRVNILYVITKLELGGAQKQLLEVIRNLDRHRFNIFLFTAKDGLLLPEALEIDSLTIKMSRFLNRPINFLQDALALIEIYIFIKKNNIHIVHTHSSKAGILGRLAAGFAGTRVIVHTVHGWSFNDYQNLPARSLFIFLERICARVTQRLIVVSGYDRYKGIKNNIAPKEKYSLIRYGINLDSFGKENRSIREEFGIQPQEALIGMIACLKPQKCPGDFVKMAYLIHKALPCAKFILVGDGVLRKQLKKLISKLKLDGVFILTGWRRDIPDILSAIDVFVLTSLWEGMPISVLEAMASLKPSVVTDTGGVREIIIEGKTGFLIKRRDINTMSERIITLLNNKALRDEIGENARMYIKEDYSIKHMINNTRQLYEELIQKGVNNGQ